jgi:hypothetical protein
MKKFILFAFLLLSTISFASNSIVKSELRNVENTELTYNTTASVGSTVFSVLPGQVCVTTVLKYSRGFYVDSQGYEVELFEVMTFTTCTR